MKLEIVDDEFPDGNAPDVTREQVEAAGALCHAVIQRAREYRAAVTVLNAERARYVHRFADGAEVSRAMDRALLSQKRLFAIVEAVDEHPLLAA